MIKLCGFALSNYYNKVKFVLLEHGIEFEEATQTIYGRDLLLEAGIDWKRYVKTINPRPAAQRVTEDRKACVAASRAS
ncbi:hypothetical protein [Paraburkholderia sp. MM5384-R2]|uniref:hypothetical protein n=1 Tax=Paraburkholderia sp. MM5384-R2 TaxID=2723097 RepID=UPI0016122E34|nr:hypothetical protein [Paraburkholderia sp. MM5384-R2]MBB5497511.1 hypothetical protein [Paraburkholderia sp. MM5384-R2]